jgi:DNA-binding transcriptional LysR family regulator
VRLTPRFMVTKVDAMLSAVRAGAGIARTLSYQVSDDIAFGGKRAPLAGLRASTLAGHLVVPTGRHMPRAVRAFLDHAAPALDALRVIHE